jgi:hypothetical protein
LECPSAIEPGVQATFNVERLTPFHRSGGRQTAAFLQQIEECGSLPRSRYAGFAKVSVYEYRALAKKTC